MAIFTTAHIKLGNIWPKDYLATTADGNTMRFRLKRREGDTLLFINANEEDTSIYIGKLEREKTRYSCNGKFYDSINECCNIEYNGNVLQLKADRCELACSELSWTERREIIEKIRH